MGEGKRHKTQIFPTCREEAKRTSLLLETQKSKQETN